MRSLKYITSPPFGHLLKIIEVLLLASIRQSHAAFYEIGVLGGKPTKTHLSLLKVKGYATHVGPFDDNAIVNRKQPEPVTHSLISWRLVPPPEATVIESLQWYLSVNSQRFLSRMQNADTPCSIVHPPTQQAMLEAYCVDKDINRRSNRIKVGRFGILTQAGPCTHELKETVRGLNVFQQKDDHDEVVKAAAILYMYVEPEYRGRGIGHLALEVIAALHAAWGCNYTLLVADDKTMDESLIQWYEHHGYIRAPLLQDMLGSPRKSYGVAMIGRTQPFFPQDCVIE